MEAFRGPLGTPSLTLRAAAATRAKERELGRQRQIRVAEAAALAARQMAGDATLGTAISSRRGVA